MKVFVTGGTGFIGSHFLRAMADSHHQMVALCRSGRKPVIEFPESIDWLYKPMNQVGGADLDGIDAVVHFASPGVSPKIASWGELMHWNVLVTTQLFETAKAAGVRRIVVAGTFAEYGRSGERFELIPTDAPLEPIFPYAASKAAGSIAAQAFCISESIELCYLRIFSAFGEGQHSSNFWPSLKKAALEGRDFDMTPGEQIRDYIPVEEVARAFVHATERNDVVAGIPYIQNVGTGLPVTMREFAEYWWRCWRANGHLKIGAIPYRPGEIMRYVPLI